MQRLEKLLEDAGIKLSSVAADPWGYRAGDAGSADRGPNRSGRDRRLAKRTLRTRSGFDQALTGRFSAHHTGFMARLFLDRIDAHTLIRHADERKRKRSPPGVPPAFRTADQIGSDPERMRGIDREIHEIQARVS